MKGFRTNQRNWCGMVVACLAALLSVSCGGAMQQLSQSTVSTGTNKAASLSLNKSSLDFGNVLVGSSKSSALTLTNASASDGPSVTFSQVGTTGVGFSVTTASLPIVLTPGQSATITLTFAPKAAGSVNGALSITVAGASDPANVPLTGTGIAQAQLAVSPSALSFGTVAVGSSLNKVATLSASNSDVTVTSVASSGQGYSVSGISLPVTVSAGQSVSFTVTFAPQAAGASTGSISVSSNAPESPTSIALTGTGSSSGSGAGPGPAQLGVSPSSLSFGTVTVGSSLNKGGTLSAGTSDVAVTSAAWSGQGYSVSGISFPVTVPAGKSVPFTVTFAPEAAGASTGSISFISNAANSPTAEAFSGTGAQAAQAPATPHTVDLSWTASSSAVLGYCTYRGTQSGGPYSKLNSSPSTNSSYSDSTVEAGQTYYYVVTSLGTDSVESAFSNQATAVVPSP